MNAVCSLSVTGQSAKKCLKVSSGTGIGTGTVPLLKLDCWLIEHRVHFLLTLLSKCDTLVLRPKMLL